MAEDREQFREAMQEIGLACPRSEIAHNMEDAVAIQEKLNPEWFLINSDQGFMPLYEVKKQMELFGTKIMPEFLG